MKKAATGEKGMMADDAKAKSGKAMKQKASVQKKDAMMKKETKEMKDDKMAPNAMPSKP